MRYAACVLVMSVILVTMPVLGQDGTLTTYTSPDGSFSFEYPQNWELTETPGAVLIDNLPIDQRYSSPDSISIALILPTDISQFSMMGQGSTPEEIIRTMAQFSFASEVAFSAEPEDFEDGELEGMDEAGERATAVEIIHETVNGFPAARALFTTGGMFGYTNSVLMMVVQLDNDKVVTLQAMSLNGEAPLIENENTILAIGHSIRYLPREPTILNAALPELYSGPIGVWQLGTLSFNYPDDWYVIPLGPFLQNTSERINQSSPESGQLQVGIMGPEFSMMSILTPVGASPESVSQDEMQEIMAAVMECRVDPTTVTAETVIQRMVTGTPEQLQQIEDGGITYSEPEPVDVEGSTVYQIRASDSLRDILIFAVDMGDGNVIIMMAFSPLAEMEQYEQTLVDIIATFEFTPNSERCADINVGS